VFDFWKSVPKSVHSFSLICNIFNRIRKFGMSAEKISNVNGTQRAA